MADKYEIDIQAFAKALQSGQNLNGKDGPLTPLIKQIGLYNYHLKLLKCSIKKSTNKRSRLG